MSNFRDPKYFEQVANHPAFRDALTRHQLHYKISKMRHNSTLWISKVAWVVCAEGMPDQKVQIHLEARRPGELRLEADTVPYIPSALKKPELYNAHRSAFQLKARLIGELRAAVLANERLRVLEPSTTSLKAPEIPGTACAAKFALHQMDSPTWEQTARSFAAAIDALAPFTDAQITQFEREE